MILFTNFKHEADGMPEKTLVPEAFGPLQGVKIVSTGTLDSPAVRG